MKQENKQDNIFPEIRNNKKMAEDMEATLIEKRNELEKAIPDIKKLSSQQKTLKNCFRIWLCISLL